VRIGQIYLEISFYREARAALRPLLESPFEPRLLAAARTAFVEASYRDRDPQEALAALDTLEAEDSPHPSDAWRVQRRGDCLLRLHRYTEAARAYRERWGDGAAGSRPPVATLRFALAELESGRTDSAASLLSALLEDEDAAPGATALGRLLLARALREKGHSQQAAEAASPVIRQRPGSDDAALAAVEVIESAGSTGEELSLPGTRELIDDGPMSAAIGLLALRLETLDPNPEEAAERRERIGRVLLAIPEGGVRDLARELLVHEIEAGIAADLAQGRTPHLDPDALEDLRHYVHPWIIGVNAVLVGTEAFYRSGDRDACRNWAAALRAREVRPMRHGLGLWRLALCREGVGSDAEGANRLLVEADSGDAGPFALAIAALAGEGRVARGATRHAVRIYERAAESFFEPNLIGPVLLRLGILLASLEEDTLARQRLLRGLTITDSAGAGGEPFRKLALLSLAGVSDRLQDHAALDRLLAQEAARADPWWAAVWTYLGFRHGAAGAGGAEAPFGDGMTELRASAELRSRMQHVLARLDRQASRGAEADR
jgi:tetratricopeptide (TPR) repeat protein